MIKPAQSSVTHGPNRTVFGEGKVTEFHIFLIFVTFAGRRFQDVCAPLVGHAAEAVIVRKPDAAIGGFMEVGVVGENESGGAGAGVVFHSLEFGLTAGQKQDRSGKGPHPDCSFMVHQDGGGETTRVSMFRANLLTDRTAHMEETS